MSAKMEPVATMSVAETDSAGTQGADYVVFYPHARGGTLGAGTARATGTGAGFLKTPIGAAATAVAVVFGLQALVWSSMGSGRGTLAVSEQTQAANPVAADLLATGHVSPRGLSARDVGAARALELAQSAAGASGGVRDNDEFAFWLRRYLAVGGGDETMRRVLTQLGSIHADHNSPTVDYVKARRLWEFAGALGDPVALCFLGTLHEKGISTPVDRAQALSWFERAKLAGGCAGADEAIARLK